MLNIQSTAVPTRDLQVQNVIVSRSVKQVNVGEWALGEVMVVHLPPLSPVHVLYSDVHSQSQCQCGDMDVITLMTHGLNLLAGVGWGVGVVQGEG